MYNAVVEDLTGAFIVLIHAQGVSRARSLQARGARNRLLKSSCGRRYRTSVLFNWTGYVALTGGPAQDFLRRKCSVTGSVLISIRGFLK